MSDERADRLRERRQRTKERASKIAEESELDEGSKPSEAGETGEQDKTDKPSVKDEQVGTYMYLPEPQHDRVGELYDQLDAKLKLEFSEELEKNREYYPLLVEYGLESLESWDAQTLKEELESLEN